MSRRINDILLAIIAIAIAAACVVSIVWAAPKIREHQIQMMQEAIRRERVNR